MTYGCERGFSIAAPIIKCLSLLAAVLLAGCASMDRQQCQVADWHLVGYQDGVLGKTAATIGDYRRDCADHAVVPDLDAWRAGREQGLQEYCTRDNGFRLGQDGRRYNAVCPASSEAAFRTAFDEGRAIYLARSRVSSTHSRIYQHRYEIDMLEEDKHDKLSALVQSGLRGDQRVMLLYEIHEIESEIDQVEREISELERDLALQQDQLEQLTRR
jgi:hypothetical protein